MATAYESLVPEAVVGQLVPPLPEQSATIRLGNVIKIPTGAASVPILSEQPTAGFVTPTYGGRKKLTQFTWSAARLVAERMHLAFSPSPTRSSTTRASRCGTRSGPRSPRRSRPRLTRRCSSASTPQRRTRPVGSPRPRSRLSAPPARPPLSLDEAMSAIEASGLVPDRIASSAAIRVALRSKRPASRTSPSPTTSPTRSTGCPPRSCRRGTRVGCRGRVVGGFDASLLVGLQRRRHLGDKPGRRARRRHRPDRR